MIGDECAANRAMLEVSYPVENGIVRNWEDMVHLWNYTFFDKMEVDPSQHNILLTEPPMNPKKNKETMNQHMFETYGFNACKVEVFLF